MATSPSAIVSRQLSTQYGRAAPELLLWAQERQFFQIQIANCTKANKSVEAAVAHNVERTIESLRDAALTCASMGLSMNPIAQLVYFIPRRERTFNEDIDKSRAEYEQNVPWIIYPSPSYRGLAFICTRYAGADDVAAEVVFKDDVFRPRGPFAIPEHHPTTDNALRKWENAIGVYAGFRWPGGRERSEYLDANMIAIIRAKSDRPGSMMWDPKQLWTEGWKKAAVRRGAKLAIQGNPRLDAAESNMRAHEGMTFEGEAREVPRGTSPTDPPPAKPRRGMSGLGESINASETKQEAAQDAEAAAAAAEAAAAPQAPQEPRKGSIEWWLAKITATTSRHELSILRDEAIAAGVDTGPDAAAFAEQYTKQSRALRLAATQQQGRTA
jgi:recombinational DNA repair protein RecT